MLVLNQRDGETRIIAATDPSVASKEYDQHPPKENDKAADTLAAEYEEHHSRGCPDKTIHMRRHSQSISVETCIPLEGLLNLDLGPGDVEPDLGNGSASLQHAASSEHPKDGPTGSVKKRNPRPLKKGRGDKSGGILPPVISPLPIPSPEPTFQYLTQSGNVPAPSSRPQPLLLVIDLNGTLIHRPNRKHPTSFKPRMDLNSFLEHILAEHTVMIWSSARPKNVALMCGNIFTVQQRALVIAEWGRDMLDLTPEQYQTKSPVYKRLEKIWTSSAFRTTHPNHSSGAQWHQGNTVLIDDSSLKAAYQPHNLVQISEYYGQSERKERPLKQVAKYLESLRWQQDVSSYMRHSPFRLTQDIDRSMTLQALSRSRVIKTQERGSEAPFLLGLVFKEEYPEEADTVRRDCLSLALNSDFIVDVG
ncbi:MAG: hypothetical protein M1817_006502 [Caeruleum heppii]|nr:MAG: hypothetical protein M1817_006502 [Caeruleum heppii]